MKKLGKKNYLNNENSLEAFCGTYCSYCAWDCDMYCDPEMGYLTGDGNADLRHEYSADVY